MSAQIIRVLLLLKAPQYCSTSASTSDAGTLISIIYLCVCTLEVGTVTESGEVDDRGVGWSRLMIDS